MSDQIAFLKALASRVYGITLENALGVMEEAERYLVATTTPALDTHLGRVEFGRTLPLVIDNLRAGRKITAIKELRVAVSNINPDLATLKNCKEAIDTLATEYPY